KEKNLGGLAGDFKPAGWDWGLERYYHHIFANDKEVIKLAKSVGWPAFFEKPVTNSLIGGKEKRLDSPFSLLKFNKLSLISRLHMGLGLAMLKFIRNGVGLEKYQAVGMLPKLVGPEGYKKVWEPLLLAKFGKFLPTVNMAWFWARVYKRTAGLGYFAGGFAKLAEKIAEEIKKNGGEIRLGTKYKVGDEKFDKILNTGGRNLGIDYLWGQTLVLELNKPLMKGYWLNVLQKNWPFLVVVEQTNFINKKYYNNKHLVYLGNYLKDKDKRLKMSKDELLELFLPYIKKINPNFNKKWITKKWKFQDPYAQPVFPVNYSKQIPKIKTKNDRIYTANTSMVYPWDRGVNYAVELGQKAAKAMMLV
ncbi:hypothetical protein KKA49_02560, partial [Patescibacteria group bacterium]|nr:hypothetical protein [Patescibacteria group bacterium]MBU1457222.1 hypothetical protein [Patescibacteria group bacterium]